MTVVGLCRLAGMSKQNFFRGVTARKRRAVDEELVIELVRAQRRRQPMLGARKLMTLLKVELEEAHVQIGRDRLFVLLRRNSLLVEKPRRSVRTTNSRHRFRVHGNLLRTAVVTAPHQAWVSDLTYVRTQEGFLYLSLVMDAYSRMIVGWQAGDTLEASGCVAALKMAIDQLPKDANPIHHSDRGTQYCCEAYAETLAERGLSVSMTEENHCYENAKAERLNGILKQEYGIGGTLRSKKIAKAAIKEGVWLYNTQRPHTNLGYRIPADVHRSAA